MHITSTTLRQIIKEELDAVMNEDDRDPRLQAVGLVQAIKAALDTANTMGTSADPGRMMKLLNQLEQAIEGI
jgi:hypothetical protein